MDVPPLRGALFVFVAIAFIWAVFYSKYNENLRLVLKGTLLVIIAICLYLVIKGGVSPENSNPLAVLGVAIVCFSVIPNPPENEGDND